MERLESESDGIDAFAAFSQSEKSETLLAHHGEPTLASFAYPNKVVNNDVVPGAGEVRLQVVQRALSASGHREQRRDVRGSLRTSCTSFGWRRSVQGW